MSDPAPERRIAGLAPRPATVNDLSRLRSRNRVVTQATPQVAAEATPESAREKPLESSGGEAGKARVSIYLDPDVRDRARAAYKATAHLAGDRSWSEFVQRAIEAEAARREQSYNQGSPYPTAGDSRLSAGRPIN